MITHTPSGGIPVPCMRATGRCRICELIDPDGPDYQESYRRLYHPEEFPDEPIPTREEIPSQLPPASPPTHVYVPLAGDIAARVISTFGGDRIARYLEKKLGTPCGCTERKERLNRIDRKFRDYLSRRAQ